jgi:NTE family protein
LLTLLPDGWLDPSRNLERVGQLLEQWPEDRLWMTAVRLPDARRVVFGRDDIDITPGQAVAASCAIPGVFTPVTVAGRRYVDGGAHSPTNADLLLGAGVKTAIVLSPMSAQPGTLGRRPDRLLRSLCRRRLMAECELLASNGIDVHVFEPDASTLRSMGANALDQSRAPSVVRDSFLAAGEQITNSPGLAAVVGRPRTMRPLTSASA